MALVAKPAAPGSLVVGPERESFGAVMSVSGTPLRNPRLLRIHRPLAFGGFSTRIGAVWEHAARLRGVIEVDFQDFIANTLDELGVAERKQDFHAMIQIARH